MDIAPSPEPTAPSRDLRVGLHATCAKGKGRLQLLAVDADICASQSQRGRRFGHQPGILAGSEERLSHRFNDVGASGR